MSWKKSWFYSIDAIPAAVLCVATLAIGAVRTFEVLREHGVSFRRHSASYEFTLPEEALQQQTEAKTEDNE